MWCVSFPFFPIGRISKFQSLCGTLRSLSQNLLSQNSLSQNFFDAQSSRNVIRVVHTVECNVQCTLIKKKIKLSSLIRKFRMLQLHIWGNICTFPHILGSPSSYMTLQQLHSEFPYIWGKFYFIFYQCNQGSVDKGLSVKVAQHIWPLHFSPCTKVDAIQLVEARCFLQTLKNSVDQIEVRAGLSRVVWQQQRVVTVLLFHIVLSSKGCHRRRLKKQRKIMEYN